MTPVVAAVIVLLAVAIAVAALLIVRRRAPEDGYFQDGDRAAGVFGVLATGFAILLGLIVVIAFTSYDDTRRAAEDEAQALRQQFETAQFLPAEARRPLGHDLVCYARAVVYEEWPKMESGVNEEIVNPWGPALFRTLKSTDPQSTSEQAAFSKWMDLNSDRETARATRFHGAVGVIPGSLWVVLFLIAGVIFVFMLFFADRSEHPVVQGVLIGSVTAVLAATLLVILFLDDPFRSSYGGLRPTAIERTLRVLDKERGIVGDTAPLPCDSRGRPVAR